MSTTNLKFIVRCKQPLSILISSPCSFATPGTKHQCYLTFQQRNQIEQRIQDVPHDLSSPHITSLQGNVPSTTDKKRRCAVSRAGGTACVTGCK
jgi:hypothetical protein